MDVIGNIEMNSIGNYIDIRKITVVEWVTTKPILYLYQSEDEITGGGGQIQRLWYQEVPLDNKGKKWNS